MMNAGNLKRELDYFKVNQNELVNKYKNKFLVIKNRKIIGVFDTEIEAYTKTQKQFKLGTFLIQQCLPGEEGYTQTFHSRVAL